MIFVYGWMLGLSISLVLALRRLQRQIDYHRSETDSQSYYMRRKLYDIERRRAAENVTEQ